MLRAGKEGGVYCSPPEKWGVRCTARSCVLCNPASSADAMLLAAPPNCDGPPHRALGVSLALAPVALLLIGA